MVTKQFGKLYAKMPGVDDIKYAATEGAYALAWAMNVLGNTQNLNRIEDYKLHLETLWVSSDESRLQTSMSNIASIEYLQNLIGTGLLYDLVVFNNVLEVGKNSSLFSKDAYGVYMNLGNWGDALTGHPDVLKDQLSPWTVVSDGITSNHRTVRPQQNLWMTWQMYKVYSKNVSYDDQIEWKWRY